MIRIITLTMVLVTATAGPTFAQGCVVPGTNISCMNASYGITVGFGFYNMSGDGTSQQGVSTSSQSGLIIGGFFEYPLGTNLFVQPEMKYIRKGMDKTHTYDDYVPLGKIAAASDEPSDKVKLSYIQMPVLFKYVIPTKGKIKPSVVLGPSLAYNLSAKDEASGWGAPWDGEFDIKNVKKFDFGGVIGAGVAYPIGNLMFGIDVRYDKSFSNAFDDVTQEEIDDLKADEVVWTGDQPLEAFDAKNGGFSISASVILPIGAAKPEDK